MGPYLHFMAYPLPYWKPSVNYIYPQLIFDDTK